MTPEQRNKIMVAAIDCAAGPPLKKNQWATRAGVPWEDIERLRAALDAVGIDWRAVKVENDKLQAEANAKKYRKYLDRQQS